MNKNKFDVQSVPLSSIHEDPANARKHDLKNSTAIRTRLQQFGQVETLVVQKTSGKVIGMTGFYKSKSVSITNMLDGIAH